MSDTVVIDTTTNVVEITSVPAPVVIIDDSESKVVEVGAVGPQGPPGAGGSLGYYGAFYDTTNQAAAAANTPYAMKLNMTSGSKNISVVANDKVYFEYPGTYNIQFSAQLDRDNSANGIVTIWIRKNGVDIPSSASEISIKGQNSETVASWNWVLDLVATDYIQVMWAADDTHAFIKATSATGVAPGIPSVILTATQVMYTQLDDVVKNLDDLQDVVIASVADGDLLSYKTAVSKWVNERRVDVLDGGNF